LNRMIAALVLCFLPGIPAQPLSAAAAPTVILDPGHGGNDRGGIGADGLLEKEITLDLAKRVQKLIDQQLGYRTFLTRKEDQEVSLDKRAALANNQQGTLLVSIHLGGSPDTGLHGYGIYIAQAPDREGNTDAKGLLLWNRQSLFFAKQSRQLAESLHAAFAESFPRTPDLGIHPLALYLARTVRMPTVLIEPAVLTNREDEAFLGQEKNRQALAEAIFQGLIRYRQSEKQ